jgi:hypothetical protein
MKSGWALVLAPSIALGAQSVMYALVTPSCEAQSRTGLHATALIALLLAVVLTALAATEWSRYRGAPGVDPENTGQPAWHRFLAAMGTAVGALSCLVILAMWFGLWVLSPCAPAP